MADNIHLTRQGNVYWFRRAIPSRYRDAFGRGELWRSLHTEDIVRARAKRDRLNAALEARFRSLDQAAHVQVPSDLAPRLLVGDCLDLLASVPIASVDLVLADLPFGGRTTAHPWDEDIDLPAMWAELLRVGRPGAVYIFFAVQPLATDLIVSNRRMFGWSEVWIKSKKTRVMKANYMPLRQHEDIIVFRDAKYTYNPLKTKRRSAPANREREHRAYHNVLYDTTIKQHTGEAAFRSPTTVHYCASVPERLRAHPTEKPVALLENLIRTYSNPGDVVLDPFAGSGSTGIAAYDAGRRSLLIERDRNFASAAKARLDGHTSTAQRLQTTANRQI